MNNKKIKVLFMGRKFVAKYCLQYLIDNETFDVIGVITDSHLPQSITAKLANKFNIPLYSFEEALLGLKNKTLNYDLGISMLFWRKLKEEFISSPKLGTINFHPAPLPEYKGTAGYNLAILESLNSWAVSAHYVDENIDTGEIIDVLKFAICKDSETVISLESRSQRYLYELFIDTIKKISSSSILRLKTTPNIGGKYISRTEMEMMKEIKPEDDVERKIRAFWFPPYDGAYVIIAGKKYSLVDSNTMNNLTIYNSDPFTGK